MREILFRGKRVDNGEWVYGDLIKHSIIDPFCYIAKGTGYKVDDPEIGTPIKVMPRTVGQFTGLKDKNGKDIYEGDLHTWSDKKGVVSYDQNLAIINVCEWKGNGYIGLPLYQLQFDTAQWGEVIGNIHEGEIVK